LLTVGASVADAFVSMYLLETEGCREAAFSFWTPALQACAAFAAAIASSPPKPARPRSDPGRIALC